MINRRSDRMVYASLLIVFIFLIIFPFMIHSYSTLILMTQIFIFAIFAMSYDILLGFTGIVSFGHAMFFGIGAYTVGIFMNHFGHSVGALILSFIVAMILTGFVSLLLGALALRLKSHYYAMLTLAFSGLFLVVAEKWRSLTEGNDGMTFLIPHVLMDRKTFYFVSLLCVSLIYLFLRRFIHSPLGRVLQSIRENEKRTESLGYRTVYYQIIASIVAGVVAGFSGGLYALLLRFVNTDVFSMSVTLDALLMTIIGGVGTLIGGIIGSGFIELAHNGLTNLAKVSPIFQRWMIFFGLLYILVVMVFPLGIVGSFRQWFLKRQWMQQSKGG